MIKFCIADEAPEHVEVTGFGGQPARFPLGSSWSGDLVTQDAALGIRAYQVDGTWYLGTDVDVQDAPPSWPVENTRDATGILLYVDAPEDASLRA